MENFFLTTVALLALSFGASAANAQNIDIECLKADGYYGNIRIAKEASGQIQIMAAQGFAYEISKQLGASLGQEASNLEITINSKSCSIQNLHGRCEGLASILPSMFSQKQPSFDAKVVLNLSTQPGPNTTLVTLAVQPLAGVKIGSASIEFGSLGQCLQK